MTSLFCTKDRKERRALVHMLLNQFHVAIFAWPAFFSDPLPSSGGYHLERGSIPIHDAFGVNCKKGAITKYQCADVYVGGVRGVSILKIKACSPARSGRLGQRLPVLRTHTAEICFGCSIRNMITCCHRRFFMCTAVDVFSGAQSHLYLIKI